MLARAIGVVGVSIACPACSLLFDARGIAEDYEMRPPDDAGVLDAGRAPQIVEFTVAPQSIASGGTAILRWETQFGDGLEISESGVAIYSSQDPAELARGWLLVEPKDPVTYTLTLSGAGADFETRSQSLLVLTPAVEAPVIARFHATPRTFLEGDAAPHDVTVDWSVGSVVDQVELAYEGTRRVVPSASSEVVSVGGTTELELTASNARGSIFATEKVWTVANELEPNDEQMQAGPLDRVAIRGQLDRGATADWFSVRTPADGFSIAAEVHAPFDSCHPDARVTLYRGDGMVMGMSGGDPLSPCATIDPRRRDFARNLGAGDYFIAVDAKQDVINEPAYDLFVSVLARRPGNSILDFGEECDDGDRVVDDGCDDQGQFETGYFYALESARPERTAPDHATKLVFEPYPVDQTEPGVGFAVVPLDYSFPFFGNNYAALIVHSSGLVTFSRRTINARPVARRAFPDPLLGVAAIAAFAGDLAGAEAVTWTFEAEGERWTAIELRDVTGRLPPEQGALSLSGRISISERGIIDLEYLAKTDGGYDPPLGAGIQDARGRIGNAVAPCSDICSVSRLPVVGSVIRFRLK